MITNPTYFLPPDALKGDEYLILFHRGEVLLMEDEFLLPNKVLSDLPDIPHSLLLVGEIRQRRVLALDLPQDWSLTDVGTGRATPRQLLLQRVDEFPAVGRANQLLHWYSTHRFCGLCGAPTRPHDNDRALVCSACEHTVYPRINPCVIVLVRRGDTCLLARHNRGNASYSSCLAGFMEVGETPEETVLREVREEVGIEVDNIRYARSQSWPFPSQLMLGFFADYKCGEIRVDGHEIAEAGWYSREALPQFPSAGISVAGQLIELFLQGF